MDESTSAEIERIAADLTMAWNRADGTAFAQNFGESADFVNIYGSLVAGRDAIATIHQSIFDSVYRDSRVLFTVKKSRALPGGTVLVHVAAELDVPRGPMAGKLRTLATAVLVRDGAGWSIAAFQNTREQTPPSSPPA